MMWRHVLTMLAAVSFCGSIGEAAAPSDELVRSLTAVIRKHCPDAEIAVSGEAFTAKSGTMKFTVHARSKTGEIFARTYEEEGPNFKGFLLRIAVESGPYLGAAAIPQTLQGPYYRTLIDGPATADGAGHYRVNFAYGSRLDADLKQALLETIPQTRFPAAKTLPEPGK